MLELQNQLEAAKADIARLRGQNEQLARDVSEMQRKQKDAAQAVDERLRKFEPARVSLDGKEFVAEPSEKRDFEANLAIFRKGDFANAAVGFVDFLSRNPQTGYRSSSLFWLGNAQYATKDYKSKRFAHDGEDANWSTIIRQPGVTPFEQYDRPGCGPRLGDHATVLQNF